MPRKANIRIVEPRRVTAIWTSTTMELSGKGIIQGAFFAACVALFALLYLGAWFLRKVLPDEHPARSRLSSDGLMQVAKVLAALLIATYFAGAIILYG